MCFSKKAPTVAPVAAAPTASPEVIDDVAVKDRDRHRKKMRSQYGRQATIIAGQQQGAATPTAPVKTALGS